MAKAKTPQSDVDAVREELGAVNSADFLANLPATSEQEQEALEEAKEPRTFVEYTGDITVASLPVRVAFPAADDLTSCSYVVNPGAVRNRMVKSRAFTTKAGEQRQARIGVMSDQEARESLDHLLAGIADGTYLVVGEGFAAKALPGDPTATMKDAVYCTTAWLEANGLTAPIPGPAVWALDMEWGQYEIGTDDFGKPARYQYQKYDHARAQDLGQTTNGRLLLNYEEHSRHVVTKFAVGQWLREGQRITVQVRLFRDGAVDYDLSRRELRRLQSIVTGEMSAEDARRDIGQRIGRKLFFQGMAQDRSLAPSQRPVATVIKVYFSLNGEKAQLVDASTLADGRLLDIGTIKAVKADPDMAWATRAFANALVCRPHVEES